MRERLANLERCHARIVSRLDARCDRAYILRYETPFRMVESSKAVTTSIEKALEVCEVLSASARGMSLSDLARALRQPPSSVHRLLAVLRRRGYVRQDEETQRYA